jgi:uncharacterized protein YdeI (BOF family)
MRHLALVLLMMVLPASVMAGGHGKEHGGKAATEAKEHGGKAAADAKEHGGKAAGSKDH